MGPSGCGRGWKNAKQSQFAGGRTEVNCRSIKGLQSESLSDAITKTKPILPAGSAQWTQRAARLPQHSPSWRSLLASVPPCCQRGKLSCKTKPISRGGGRRASLTRRRRWGPVLQNKANLPEAGRTLIASMQRGYGEKMRVMRLPKQTQLSTSIAPAWVERRCSPALPPIIHHPSSIINAGELAVAGGRRMW